MGKHDLPSLFDEFVDARKMGFLAAKEFKENGGKLAGCLCSYTPQELLDDDHPDATMRTANVRKFYTYK